MNENDAIRVATDFLTEKWGRTPELVGVRRPSKRAYGWTVIFKTVLPGGHPEEIVDGPTVVVVDETTGEARLFVSM